MFISKVFFEIHTNFRLSLQNELWIMLETKDNLAWHSKKFEMYNCLCSCVRGTEKQTNVRNLIPQLNSNLIDSEGEGHKLGIAW